MRIFAEAPTQADAERLVEEARRPAEAVIRAESDRQATA
jgi:hypothetical protein